MTRACFRRTAMIARELGWTVEVLTFNDDPEYAEIARYCREEGELGDLPLRNMYCELSSSAFRFPEPVLDRLPEAERRPRPLRPIAGLQVEDSERDAAGLEYRRRFYRDAEGALRRTDFVSADGRVFLIDEQRSDSHGPRRISFLARQGSEDAPLFQTSETRLRQLWLDAAIGGSEAVVAIDDNRVARSLSDYRRENLYKVFIHHTMHIEDGGDPATGSLRRSHVPVYRKLSSFDALVNLTERQRQDMRDRLDPACRMATIPNVNPTPEGPIVLTGRDEGRGILVTRIDENKQLEHAVEAMNVAVDLAPHIRLDVYGGPTEGPVWESVQQSVQERGLEGSITFHGHVGAAAGLFAEASFTMLTSRFEGQGMVLPEAMSRGAIPVAYDIDYGPRDMIEDGVSGYLVPPQDFEALGRRIAGIANGEAPNLALRRAGVQAAAEFDAEHIARHWDALVRQMRADRESGAFMEDVGLEIQSITINADGSQSMVLLVRGIKSGLFAKLPEILMRVVEYRSLRFVDVTPLRSHRRPSGVELEFRFGRELGDRLPRGPQGPWLRMICGDVVREWRLEWPEAWPHKITTRTPYGNVNLN